jgi:hypothetical protein
VNVNTIAPSRNSVNRQSKVVPIAMIKFRVRDHRTAGLIQPYEATPVDEFTFDKCLPQRPDFPQIRDLGDVYNWMQQEGLEIFGTPSHKNDYSTGRWMARYTVILGRREEAAQ